MNVATDLPSCDTPDSFRQHIPYEFYEEEAYLFSSWGATIGSTATPNLQEYRMLTSPETYRTGDKSNTAVHWTCSFWGRELIRFAENGVPQNRNRLTNDDAQHETLLKGRVEFHGAGDGTVRDFDIKAGVRFGVVANRVKLKVLAPVSSIRDPVQDATLSGLLLDTVVGCAMAPSYTAPGRQILTNTFVHNIFGGATNIYAEVPPGAIRVTIYQTADGQLLTPRWQTYGNVLSGNIGEIILGADRRVDHIEVPGQAKVINLCPVADNEARNVTVIWELEM